MFNFTKHVTVWVFLKLHSMVILFCFIFNHKRKNIEIYISVFHTLFKFLWLLRFKYLKYKAWICPVAYKGRWFVNIISGREIRKIYKKKKTLNLKRNFQLKAKIPTDNFRYLIIFSHLAAVPGHQHVPGAVLHRHQHSFRLSVPGGSATKWPRLRANRSVPC